MGRAYPDRHNYIVREEGRQLADRYASLAAKPPKPEKKSSIGILLEEGVDEAAV
jgi:hypothetical protein